MAPYHPSAQAGGDDDISPASLFTIAHLMGPNLGEFRRCHPRSAQHPLPLQECRCRDHDHQIAATIGTGLKQQRDIEDDKGKASALTAGKKASFGLSDQRVQEGLQGLESIAITQDDRPQFLAIDAASRIRYVPKTIKDRRDRFAAWSHQLMHHRIRVMDRHRQGPKQGRCGGFAHGDGAGKT